jgi:hypothetical protein
MIVYRLPGKQRGASLIVNLIILALIGIGVFIALQYVPQRMETGTIDKIMEDVEKDHQDSPFNSINDIKGQISNKLNINDMNDMMQHVSVKEIDGGYDVNITYERELNLIYTKKPVVYDRTIKLMR